MFSDDEFDSFLNPEELLAGLPAKRARTLLFLLENRTSRLAAASWQVIDEALTDASTRGQDLKLLDDFIAGNGKAAGPTIQELERYAPQWADQVPGNPRIQAALAKLMSEKYRFTARSIPNIRAALSLDDERVQSAYRSMYRQSLESIYVQQLTFLDDLRWIFAGIGRWLEAIPPFWMACLLTITLNTSSAVLAFPTAVATVGPSIGLGLIVLFGICNTLTILCTVEAMTRSGSMRFGKPFIGRLIADYLGSAGTFLFSLSLGVGSFLALLSVYIGISTTLADFTGLSPALWAVVVFLIGVVILARGSLNLPVGLMFLLGAAQILLLIILAAVALTHTHPQYLLAVPFSSGHGSFDFTRFGAFGVIYLAYTAQHKLITQLARSVLPRDPEARSLIGGTIVGTVCMILVFCIWVLGTSADFAPQRLATYSGTVLTLLSQQNGPIVGILGFILLVISLGVGSLRESSAISQLVRELLPHRPHLILPRRRGQLLFESRWRSGAPVLSLTYLGLEEDQSCFRWDIQAGEAIFHEEIYVTDTWDISTLYAKFPVLRQMNIRLSLKMQEANEERAYFQLQTPIIPTYLPSWDPIGFSMSGLFALDDPDMDVINMIMRQGEASVAQVASYLGQTEDVAGATLQALMKRGYLRQREVDRILYYQPRIAPKQGGRLSGEIWQALDDKAKPFSRQQASPGRRRLQAIATRLSNILLSDAGRFVLATSPILCILLLTEVLLFSGAQSFSRPFSISGVVTGPIFAGIIPILMLAASRHKGDSIPRTIYKFLGHPLFIGSMLLIFLVYLLLHGLAIWTNPIERLVALSAAAFATGTSFLTVRRGAFIPRMVIELREDVTAVPTQTNQGTGTREGTGAAARTISCSIIADGRPVIGAVQLGYVDAESPIEAEAPIQEGDMAAVATSPLHYAIFHPPATSARELKVWVHRITAEQESEAIPAVVEVISRNKTNVYDLKLFNGQLVIPLLDVVYQLKITLSAPSSQLES